MATAAMESFAVESVLPANLAEEALDVTLLQEALMRVEQLQQSTRAALFKKLAALLLAQQPRDGGAAATPDTSAFDAAISELCAEAAQLLPDTPEAMLAQYAQHYRTLVEQEQQLVGQQRADAAEREVLGQLAEFGGLLRQGQLSEAAWCVQRLGKSLQEAQEAAAAPQASGAGADADAGGPQGAGEGAVPASGLTADVAAQAGRRHLAWCDGAREALAQVVKEGLAGSVQLLPPPPGQQHAHPQLLLRASIALPLAQAAQAAHPAGGGDVYVDASQRAPVPSAEVWAAAAALGLLPESVQALADLLMREVLGPLLRGQGCWSGPQKQPDGGSLLQWQPVPAPAVADACRTVLQAVGSVAFGLDEALLRPLGDALWAPLADAYVDAHVRPAAHAASQAGDSAALQALVQAASDLEEWASSLGFIDVACLAPAVSAAVSALEARQQVAPLAAARQALLADLRPDVQTTVVGEPLQVDSELYQRLLGGRCPTWEAQDPGCGLAAEAPLLSEGQRRVTAGAVRLAQLVGQVLDQALASGAPAASLALVHSLRKLAALAIALPEATPGARQQLATVLPLALLHFNRLWHLADALLLALPVYAPALEPRLGEPLGLMEPALLLRAEAERLLQRQVAAQGEALQELMASGFRGFSRLGAAGTGQDAIAYRKTVSQLLHTLGRMGRALADHLTPAWIAQVAQQVLGRMCSSLVAVIMAKSDIGIDDCKELREVLGPLAQQGVEALVRPSSNQEPPETAKLSGVPVPVLREVVASTCQPLLKLRKLLELLDTGLRETVVAWEKRRLQAVGFTADEVVHLLCALFEPSEYRRDAIARIRASAW